MKRLAVVEDNLDNQLLVEAILSAHYDLTLYDNGAVALEGIRSDCPDLVLLDISLPEMDGTEVLKHIRADDTIGALPVIALTAHAMAGDREKYLGLGFDGYVTKPIEDEQVLLSLIEALLS